MVTFAYLILSLRPPFPLIPRSSPSAQVPAASDCPVHHEVAFVQLWPRRHAQAAFFRRQKSHFGGHRGNPGFCHLVC